MPSSSAVMDAEGFFETLLLFYQTARRNLTDTVGSCKMEEVSLHDTSYTEHCKGVCVMLCCSACRQLTETECIILFVFNPLPVQFKALLHGQKGCVFFSGHLNFPTAPETGLPSRGKKS